MECDLSKFVPDDLMDILPDFMFDDDNGTSKYSQVSQKSSKSPFYESDSGISEIAGSVAGSTNSPQGYMELTLDELVDTAGFRPFSLDPDQELQQFLQKDDSKFENVISYPSSSIHCQLSRNTVERATLVDDCDTTSVTDICNSGSHISMQNRIIKSTKKRQSRPYFLRSKGCSTLDYVAPDRQSSNNTILKIKPELRSASTESDELENVDVDGDLSGSDSEQDSCFQTICSNSTDIKYVEGNSKSVDGPSVRVLRVVKTSSGDSTAAVVRALEERNKRNAVQAKVNRQKKKAYIQNLEEELEKSRSKVKELEEQFQTSEEERNSWKREVQYLKSVLANQSALAGLLQNIPSVKGVNLSSSLCAKKRSAEMDHSYTPSSKIARSFTAAGICLHVDNNNVSLEFCSHCADLARGALN